MDWWWQLTSAMDAHEGQAAWAQAVGTVAAVWLTSALAFGAGRTERNRQLVKRQLAIFFATRATHALGQILHRLEKEVVSGWLRLKPTEAAFVLHSGELQELLSVINDVTPVDLPSARSARAYMQVRGVARDLKGRLELIAQSGRTGILPVVEMQATLIQPRATLLGYRRALRSRRGLWNMFVSGPARSFVRAKRLKDAQRL